MNEAMIKNENKALREAIAEIYEIFFNRFDNTFDADEAMSIHLSALNEEFSLGLNLRGDSDE